jgi:hypothetical protein
VGGIIQESRAPLSRYTRATSSESALKLERTPQGSQKFKDGSGKLAHMLRVAWAHDWVSDPTLAAVFKTLS